jgi:heat shock protein beta
LAFCQVIYFTDPVDEYLMQYLMDYEDQKFQNVSKEGLKLGKDSKAKELKESFKELTKWWKGALASENVDDVKISNRLADTPCIVVTSKYGWSANMERIMQAQTLSDANKQAYMRGKRVLEINPRHPIIKELRERVVKDPEVNFSIFVSYLVFMCFRSMNSDMWVRLLYILGLSSCQILV